MPAATRREFLSGAAAAAGAFAILGPAAWAQQQEDRLAKMRAAGATAKITSKLLRRNIYVLQGSGGNIAMYAGAKAKLVVDSGFSTSRPQISEAIAAVGAAPVSQLINTHWHFDHTDGNEWMHTAGASILAHENTRKRLSTATRIEALGITVPPAPAAALPTVLVQDAKTVRLDDTSLDLKHYPPAHTDGDLSIHFAEANVFHTGDTWFNKSYPFIDTSTGGSIDGMITAARTTLASVDADTIIIPGHGPVGTKAEPQEFATMLAGSREAIAALKRQGKTLPEVLAAKPTASFDAKFSPDGQPSEMFIGIVYAGV